jgi:hypothetical protein
MFRTKILDIQSVEQGDFWPRVAIPKRGQNRHNQCSATGLAELNG